MDNDFATGYALGADSGSGKRDDGMLGGDGSWIFAFLIIALIFGGNGFGGFGGKAGGQGGADTRAAISDGFALNGLENGIRGIQNGLCDGFYAMNTGMLTGFNGIQSQMFAQSAQSQACCCETQRLIERGFADTNYNLATQACDTRNTIQNTTRDILENNNANTRAILDFLTNDKIASLQAENQTLKFAASQSNQNAYLSAMSEAQTAELIRRLGPSPIPAYTVPAPYPYCVGSSCGCGC